jgi:hypothetical protein
MNKIKCFLIEKVEPEQMQWAGGIGSPLYKRADTGEIKTINQFGVGAIWRGPDYEDNLEWCGADGKCYFCETPGGTWMIDGRANNCNLPNDKVHKCWVRTGEAPNFTAGKEGNTCSAGAGSIKIGKYHGFLINGELVECP